MNDDTYDVVFLHAGGKNPKGLQGPFIPIGMLGLASHLSKAGMKVKIFNLLMEKILDRNFTDEDFLDSVDSLVFCIDLHWFVHAYESIELARLIKLKKPESTVVVGGLTSSFFAGEIISKFDFIDFVIKGDSEYPLVKLVESLKTGSGDMHDIPNLTYMDGELVDTSIDFRIDNDELDNLDFLDFEFVNNWSSMFYLYNSDYKYSRKSNNDLSEYYKSGRKPFWIVYTGRGCNFNCSFCGGSSNAFKKCFNRSSLILRDPVKVAEDIIKLDSLGIESIYIPHSPFTVTSDYHNRLLDELEKRVDRLNAGFMFEDFPFYFDEKLNKRYCRIFNTNNSLYLVCIGSINEKIGKMNRCYISPERILDICRFGSHTGSKVQLCFILGLPGETNSSIYQQGLFINNLMRKGINISLYTAEMHPASNIFCDPEEFHVDLEIGNFMSYYDMLKNKGLKNMIHGYKLKNGTDINNYHEIISSIIDDKRKIV